MNKTRGFAPGREVRVWGVGCGGAASSLACEAAVSIGDLGKQMRGQGLESSSSELRLPPLMSPVKYRLRNTWMGARRGQSLITLSEHDIDLEAKSSSMLNGNVKCTGVVCALGEF